MYCIRQIIGHKNNEPILKNVLEHRGKNKGNLKIFKCVYTTNKYIKKYIYVDKEQEPWTINSDIKIQKYKPKEYYNAWHSELDGLIKKQKRILVFTTYLNTINKGGETEFFYQKQKIKPVTGKTIIFPAYWTHTHRGCVTNETKYIITGWYTYVH